LDGFLLAEQTIWEGLAAYAAADGAQLLEIEGTRAVITGSSYEAFNAVFSVDPAPLAAIEKLVGLCRDAGAPVLWHVWPRAGEQLERSLLDRGLVFYEEEPAMLADLTLGTGSGSAGPPPELAVTRVETAAELEAWVRLLAGSDDIGFIRDVVRLRAASGYGERAAFEHLLGRVDGEAVAIAAVFHGRRAGEVQHVVTARRHRRRSLGAAITRAALGLLRRRGHSRAFLTASPEGLGVYSRLGFEPIGNVRRFVLHAAPMRVRLDTGPPRLDSS
jgi:GNAT superfamily N-acetyltransferase